MADYFNKIDKVIEYLRVNPEASNLEVIRKLKVGSRTVTRAAKVLGLRRIGGAKTKNNDILKEDIRKEFGENSGIIEINSLTINTLEQAINYAEVDLEKWEIERHVINSWQVTLKVKDDKAKIEEPVTRTNWQIKIWLKPKVKDTLKESILLLIKEIPKFEPVKVKYKFPEGDYALEMAPYDIHFGKLAWGKETGQGDYDLKIAAKWFLQAIEQNLNFASAFPISKVYYIIGQDLMHVENYMAITPIAGHGLDSDGRLPKIYMEAKASTLKSIYLCREVAPVEVLWIPGNHDMHASYFLAEVIKEHFRNDDYVTVDTDPSWRKARLWGNLLVGYTHDASGGKAKITVNMLPQFWPQLWGKSKFREWHVGHKHKKNEEKFSPVLTVGGVIIRQLPTLSVIDAWHYQKEFVDAVPAGESFIWTKDSGICAHYTANVREAAK